MGIVYTWNSLNGSGGVATYPTLAAFPVSAADGSLAVALDTDALYVFNASSMTWLALGAPSSVLSIGTIDSQAPGANGATLNIHALIMQSASTSFPGLINLAAQSFAGDKTFTGLLAASNLSGTNTGDVSLGTASGLSLSGQILSLQLSDATHTGALSATDWVTFNSKQAAGSYITALTGGVIASGPGSAVATVITNANLTGPITSIGNATSIASQTGTGTTFVMDTSPTLITPIIGVAAGTSLSLSSLTPSTVIITDGSDNLISSITTSTELSYVSGVTSAIQTQLNAKQPSGSYITALTGDVTASGPGSATATIASNAVTNAKLAQMPTLTLKGNNTGSTANALDLTVSQVQSLLSIPTSSSPLPTLSGGTGTSATFTPKSVIFVDPSGNFTQDNINFNWDDSTNRLSLGGHLSTAGLGISVTGTEVGIDLTSSATNTALQVTNQGAQFVAQFTNSTNSATQGAAFGGAFSRGTTTARLQSLAGDQLTTFSAQGYNGTSFGPGYSGAVAFIATENTTSSNNGGQIVFATTPNGSLVPAAALVLGQNKLLQLPGYTTAGFLHNDTSGNVATFTPAQTNAVLPVFTSTLNGLVPLSGGGTTNFLRADGTWTAPAQLLPAEERITLSGTDITNQYVDLAFPIYGVSASSNSASLTPYRGPLQLKTVDYTVSLTGGTAGVTRITFAGDLATGGAAALIAGNILIITYMH